jgi:hypothetical protein
MSQNIGTKVRGIAVQGEQGWSEDDLYKAAVRGNPGASVEAMRRLRESIDKLRTSSDRYATWMLWLTVVLAIRTAAQLVSAVEIIRTWVAGERATKPSTPRAEHKSRR